MVAMLWTSNSENCGNSPKKDISRSKRPSYIKQISLSHLRCKFMLKLFLNERRKVRDSKTGEFGNYDFLRKKIRILSGSPP